MIEHPSNSFRHELTRPPLIWLACGIPLLVWLLGEIFLLLTQARFLWAERIVELTWRAAVAILLIAQGRLLSKLSLRPESPRMPQAAGEPQRPTEPRGDQRCFGPSAGLAPAAESLEWAYRLAMAKLEELERRWSQNSRSGRGAEDAAGQVQAKDVAQVAEAMAAAFRATREPDSVVRNLTDIAAGLRAAAALDGSARDRLQDHLEALVPPKEWSDQAGRPPFEYLAYLVDYERRAQDLLATLHDAAVGGRTIDWRGPAEALLPLAGSRRPAPGDSDPHGFCRLHEHLLRLLDYEEISVAVGDSIDRDIHSVESVRPTREHRPNSVIAIIAPGYRDRARGKVWRKAIVVLSEQYLG